MSGGSEGPHCLQLCAGCEQSCSWEGARGWLGICLYSSQHGFPDGSFGKMLLWASEGTKCPGVKNKLGWIMGVLTAEGRLSCWVMAGQSRCKHFLSAAWHITTACRQCIVWPYKLCGPSGCIQLDMRTKDCSLCCALGLLSSETPGSGLMEVVTQPGVGRACCQREGCVVMPCGCRVCIQELVSAIRRTSDLWADVCAGCLKKSFTCLQKITQKHVSLCLCLA